ncbi:portal protein (endogenous virus) [Clostridium phage phiCTC2B]|uniref:portal protein n=1 Tax=Clostridium phage phiCT19406B TaxID=1567010 RepID=UPI0003038D8E|nr:phage portal protein [Clostridium tetani]YP_009276930.1 portal protein [Clostridium phage phiCT19406B]YP_009277374.1 portal protein [Clostridium phage phiCTC2B]AJA42790.1 portal protein [Clostridium phage phiCT19406B]AJA42986.1 portal protein [Clostridium phage phiCTC2B]KGI39116.1 portal protein [Clostridium tetani]KGI43685.1 portal protein [Clostridium tetani]KHO31367.1 portal protein [Clostridium tetani]
MKLFNWVKSKFKNETVNLNNPKLLEWLGIDPLTNKDKLSDATYFACIKKLSESVGKLTLKMYQNTNKGIVKSDKTNLYNVLKSRPNPYMTAATFWSTVEMNRLHYGNAYVWCRYSGPKLQDLWIMPSSDVIVVIDNKGVLGTKDSIWYKYQDRKNGKTYTFNNKEVMHFKTSTTFDGIIGKSVREILATTIEGSLESQNFMNNLYKNGLTAKAVLEYTGDLDDTAKTRLVKGFEGYATGSTNAGKIIPVPLGMRLVPLDLKLTDSQFFELKKYSALQIASAFGIMPSQINDFEKSSYASAESQNLAFYTDTLLYILKHYEEEITYKILSSQLINNGYFFKFNVNAILRADMKTQMESLAKAVNNGIYTPNEARNYLDMPTAQGGDALLVNGNYMPIEMAGEQYKKGGNTV